jgi:hypothetical protein
MRRIEKRLPTHRRKLSSGGACAVWIRVKGMSKKCATGDSRSAGSTAASSDAEYWNQRSDRTPNSCPPNKRGSRGVNATVCRSIVNLPCATNTTGRRTQGIKKVRTCAASGGRSNRPRSLLARVARRYPSVSAAICASVDSHTKSKCLTGRELLSLDAHFSGSFAGTGSRFGSTQPLVL